MNCPLPIVLARQLSMLRSGTLIRIAQEAHHTIPCSEYSLLLQVIPRSSNNGFTLISLLKRDVLETI